MRNKGDTVTKFFLILASIVVIQKNILGKEKENYKIIEEPFEMSILAIQNGRVFDEKWSIFQEAFKDTNVKLKSSISKNLTDEMQAFNLSISSGKLPDIISLAFPNKLESLGMEGGVIPLDDLIKEHAPNIKKFFEKYPRYKRDATAYDGKIYFIPAYYDWYKMRASQGLFIRKDWLDKLGLKVPNTMDEFYMVMKAFKEKDPNGNGIVDEIPYFERTSEYADKELIGLFGARRGFYVENGIVKYGPTQEIFKEVMPQIIKWYKEGLIDPEIFSRGFSARDYMLRNNLGGMTFDWFASTSSYNLDKELNEKIKGFNFSVIPPPEYKGKRYAPDSRATNLGGWSITSSAKNPIVAIKYMDYWFSEKGYELFNWGIKGDTFEKDKNGKKYFTDKIMKGDGTTPVKKLSDHGVQFRIGSIQDYEYEKAWGNSEANKWAEIYMENNYIVESMPTLKYTVQENKRIQKINSQLDMNIEEMSQKWILGSENFEKTYDLFLKKINDIGLKEALEINQKAYDRFMRK